MIPSFLTHSLRKSDDTETSSGSRVHDMTSQQYRKCEEVVWYQGQGYGTSQISEELQMIILYTSMSIEPAMYCLLFFLNFIYITTITKQVIQLILIMLVDQHRCLRSDGLRVGGNRSSARRKPTCRTCWPHDHLTCRRRVSSPGRSDERRVR